MTKFPHGSDPPISGVTSDDELYRGHPWPGICLPQFYRLAVLLLVAGIAAKYLGVPSRFLTPGYAVVMTAICLMLFYRILVISRTLVVIDAERIEVHSGLWNRAAISVELFHVISVRSYEPLWQRFFKVGIVIVVTTELPHPLVLAGITCPDQLRENLNEARLARRAAIGVREVNVGSVEQGYT